MKLEICTNSYQSAINAEKAGAHRIELCSELAVGGVTPSYGLLQKIMSTISIPVHVLIRPRSGDFAYSNDEFEIMKENILLCKKLNCAGIVSGILHTDHSIDIERTSELVELTKPLNFTFHRAFDWVNNPTEEIKKLEGIGVDRVLTSGQETSAKKGIEFLEKLQAETDLIIMPGGGIKSTNAHLFKERGFQEIHASASKKTQTIEAPRISMNSQTLFNETLISYSHTDEIKNILQKLQY